MTRFKLESIDTVGYNITALYEIVASQMGETWNADNIRFDCTKINVAKNIYRVMEEAAVEKFRGRHSEEGVRNEFAMTWCFAGPKAIDRLADNEVEVEEGFVTYAET